MHGYSRFTGDLDILLALDAANLERKARLMAAARELAVATKQRKEAAGKPGELEAR